jgi:polar amino acid transport system substrate-binding protein
MSNHKRNVVSLMEQRKSGNGRCKMPGLSYQSRAIGSAFATLAALLIAAPAQAESTLESVLKRGTFKAGIVAAAPPAAMLDASGHQIGYSADVARYLARRLGVKLEFVPVTSASRVPLLNTGRIDAEVAVTTPNKVRNEVVDFTYSYIWDEGVLITRAGESSNYRDYLNPTKVIGAEQGTGAIPRWQLISPNAKFKFYSDDQSVVLALKKGDVDGHITTRMAAQIFAKSGGLSIGETWTNSPDAIMVRQDDSKWRNWLNWALQRMWVEGTLQKIYQKWYGVPPPFSLGDYGQVQPRVTEIGQTDDPWHELLPGFLDTLLGDKSYTLDE